MLVTVYSKFQKHISVLCIIMINVLIYNMYFEKREFTCVHVSKQSFLYRPILFRMAFILITKKSKYYRRELRHRSMNRNRVYFNAPIHCSLKEKTTFNLTQKSQTDLDSHVPSRDCIILSIENWLQIQTKTKFRKKRISRFL